MSLQRLLILGGLVALVTAAAGSAAAEDWGPVKGKVVWAGDKLPTREPLKVDKDKEECLRKGPLLSETWVVDPKTKGVRYAMVWLIDASAKSGKDYKKPIPIHPKLKEVKDKKVVLDQPCCMFEPRVLGLREGQVLVAKNSGGVAHNTKIDGGTFNPNINPLIPPGKEVEVEGWKATGLGAVPVGCSIHGWMNGYIRVFNHPYFAVTNEKGEFEIKDAPAGEYRLVIWHPEKGFVTGGAAGVPVSIKPNTGVDLGKIDLTP